MQTLLAHLNNCLYLTEASGMSSVKDQSQLSVACLQIRLAYGMPSTFLCAGVQVSTSFLIYISSAYSL